MLWRLHVKRDSTTLVCVGIHQRPTISGVYSSYRETSTHALILFRILPHDNNRYIASFCGYRKAKCKSHHHTGRAQAVYSAVAATCFTTHKTLINFFSYKKKTKLCGTYSGCKVKSLFSEILRCIINVSLIKIINSHNKSWF
jgi:hypothetical protein